MRLCCAKRRITWCRAMMGLYLNFRFKTIEFQGKNFSEFKERLAEALVEKILPISKEIKKLLNDSKYLDDIMLDGSNKAGIIATKKIKEIKLLVGF